MPSSLSVIAALMNAVNCFLPGKSRIEVSLPMLPAAPPPFALFGPSPSISEDFQKPNTACSLNAATLHSTAP